MEDTERTSRRDPKKDVRAGLQVVDFVDLRKLRAK
jgi:hypothetical protein